VSGGRAFFNDAGQAVREAKVAVLGVSYKAAVGDMRESPAMKIMALLNERGADLSYHDAYVPELPTFGLVSTPLDAAVDSADLVVIVTAHPDVDHEQVARDASLLLDFRGVTRNVDRSAVMRL